MGIFLEKNDLKKCDYLERKKFSIDLSDRCFSLIGRIKNGQITHSGLKFRSKKKDTSIVIPKSTINLEYGSISIYKKKFGFKFFVKKKNRKNKQHYDNFQPTEQQGTILHYVGCFQCVHVHPGRRSHHIHIVCRDQVSNGPFHSYEKNR